MTRMNLSIAIILGFCFALPCAGQQKDNIACWLTKGDSSVLFRLQPATLSFGNHEADPAIISVDESQTYQSIDGLGFALTGGSATPIMRMNAARRKELLQESFDTSNAHIGVSYVRLSIGASGQGFLKAKGERIVNSKGQNVILRGIGLGGWMVQEGYMLNINNGGQQYAIRQRIEALLSKEQTAEFYKSWLSNFITKTDLDSLAAWGFNSVRLPMHYNLFTLPAESEPVSGQDTWLTKGFALTDSLLSWCRANHLYLILDLHAAPGGQGNDLNIADRDPSKPSLWDSERNRKKTIALWRKLAAYYAADTTIGGYDLLNEPNWGFADTANDKHGLKENGNAPLWKLLQEITAAIRQVDKNHLLIIEGNGWGNNYHGLPSLWDKNMVLSFHKYWNANDMNSIKSILAFRSRYHVPVWLGETGENSNTWYSQAVRLFETNNIGWSWWPLKKLGNNNPLQVRSNLNYNDLADYWNGKRPKPPKESNVYSGLLDLARYTRFESNIQHPDVIDALFRQPFSHAVRPFKEHAVSADYELPAVDYDLGGNGFAYYDKDTANEYISSGKESEGNRGGVYRNDGVDIYKDSSAYERYYVGSVEDGEWLNYTINILEKGTYHLSLIAAPGEQASRIRLVFDGQPAKSINIAGESSSKNWRSFPATDVELNAGIHHLRVYADKGGFNLSAIKFAK